MKYLYLIPLFPLLGFLFNFIVGVRVLTKRDAHGHGDGGHGAGHGDHHEAPSPIIGLVAAGSVFLSFLVAVRAVLAANAAPDHSILEVLWAWIPAGLGETAVHGQAGASAFAIDWAYLVDPLSSVMLLVV